MFEFVLILILLIPVILGLAELLHIFKLSVLRPKKPIVAYKMIFLTDDSCVEQLLYAKEQFLWQGKSQYLNLVIINSNLSKQNFDDCAEIAEKFGFIFCSADELQNYIKLISG